MTFIVGNGIGRSIDNNYFNLSAGLGKVWNAFSKNNKKILLRLLDRGIDEIGPPQGEEELKTLHEVVAACQMIADLDLDDVELLSSLGKKMPGVLNRYIAKTASYFHSYPRPLPEGFIDFADRFGAFIKKNRSHVCTLNYDNLLYGEFIDRNILAGFNGHLIDGFTGRKRLKFQEDNLMRKYGKTLGYYLHLHGSPLFVDEDNDIIKLSRPELLQSLEKKSVLRNSYRHCVLTHVSKKTEVISNSLLLNVYWEMFRDALKESSIVVVIGYGGYDTHLNRIVRKWVRDRENTKENTSVIIVERITKSSVSKRKEFWAKKFSSDENDSVIKIRRLSTILDYDFNI